jgi:hypothetical protein
MCNVRLGIDKLDRNALGQWPGGDGLVEYPFPIATKGDGNCLPRAMSRCLFGTEERYTEVRVRLTVEGVINRQHYSDNFYLRNGLSRDSYYDIFSLYVQMGGAYNEENRHQDTTLIYNNDVFLFRMNRCYGGMFQVK